MIRAIHKRLEEREEGFTLIELLVVVIIIGILAAIAIPAFLNQREGAWMSAVESDLRNAALAMETEATSNMGTYPTALPSYNATQDVTVARAASSSGTAFCLTGSHANINSGATVAIYDSTSGGVERATSC